MDLRGAVATVLPSVRVDLERMVRIPSVSADPAAADYLTASAELVAELFLAEGVDVEVLSVEGGRPAVVGRKDGPAGTPTVLLYAHHDVQPTGSRAEWDGDPFEPTERDGRLYGRGSADDKAGIALHLAVLRAYGDTLPCSVVVLVEGEEEVGSPTLAAFLAAHRDRLAADVIVLADSTNWTVDVPALTTSLRGGAHVEVELRTLDHSVHSGVYGGAAPDALTALCRLLATLHHPDGSVAVTGLHSGTSAAPDYPEEQFRADAGVLDGVQLLGTGSLTDRLWNGPSLTVVGLDAPPTATATPTLVAAAKATVSLRVAPGDDADRAQQALVEHLETHTPWGARVTVTPQGTATPYRGPLAGRAYDAAHAAFAAAWGTPAVDTGVGGSIPFVAAFATQFPEAEVLITGVEDPDTRAHGANESLHLAMFERCVLGEALLLERLGQDQVSAKETVR